MNQPIHYHYEYEWGLEGDEVYQNEYDSQQNLVKQTVKGSTSNGNSYTKTYEYTYDDAENCICGVTQLHHRFSASCPIA